MSESEILSENPADTITALLARTAQLEEQLAHSRLDAEAQIIQAELRAEAARAGIVDFEGLKLLDAKSISVGPDGRPEGIASHIANFKQAKPWLFGGRSSTHTGSPPPAQPIKPRLASEMTDEEYRIARAIAIRETF